MATPRLGLVVEDKPTELSCCLTLRGSGADIDSGIFSRISNKWVISLHLEGVAGSRWQSRKAEHSITVSSTRDCPGFYSTWIRGRVVHNHIAVSASITLLTAHPVPLNSDVGDIN